MLAKMLEQLVSNRRDDDWGVWLSALSVQVLLPYIMRFLENCLKGAKAPTKQLSVLHHKGIKCGKEGSRFLHAQVLAVDRSVHEISALQSNIRRNDAR